MIYTFLRPLDDRETEGQQIRDSHHFISHNKAANAGCLLPPASPLELTQLKQQRLCLSMQTRGGKDLKQNFSVSPRADNHF